MLAPMREEDLIHNLEVLNNITFLDLTLKEFAKNEPPATLIQEGVLWVYTGVISFTMDDTPMSIVIRDMKSVEEFYQAFVRKIGSLSHIFGCLGNGILMTI